MKRLVDKDLKDWKESTSRKSLLLRGARQVGKTFSVREFGKSYPDFYEINFEKRRDLHVVFERDLDPVRILRDLSIDRGTPISPGETLLFLDEIQACPQAILSLRYFYEEMPSLHVIGAGSLLEFAIDQVGIPVGRVQTLTVYPVSFAEFLVAKGQQLLLKSICDKTDLSSSVHDQAIRLLSEYIATGGLPEIVANWATHGQPLEIADNLNSLISAYRQDFDKYAKRNQLKYLSLLLEHVPLQIGKKFKFQRVGYRKRDLAPCVELMEKAHIVHRVYHTSGHGIPLGAQADLEKFKLVLFDVGVTQQLLGLDLKGWFLQPEAEFINKGELVESFVGQELIAYSRSNIRNTLYYWQREARGSEAETDYLTVLDRKVIPLEVKAGKGSQLKSLHSFLSAHPDSPYGIKISTAPRSRFEKITSIPLYAVFEAAEDGKERVLSLLR